MTRDQGVELHEVLGLSKEERGSLMGWGQLNEENDAYLIKGIGIKGCPQLSKAKEWAGRGWRARGWGALCALGVLHNDAKGKAKARSLRRRLLHT